MNRSWSGWPFLVTIAASLLALAGGIAAMVVLAATGRGRRRWSGMVRQVRLQTMFGIGAFTVPAFLLPLAHPDTLSWPPTAVVALVATVLVVLLGRHCAAYR